MTGKHCGQVCGKVKLFCEHPCQNTCHGQTRKLRDPPPPFLYSDYRTNLQ